MKTSSLFLLLGIGAAAASSLVGCQQAPNPVELLSLRQSGDVSFLCVGAGADGSPLSSCPQGRRNDDRSLSVGPVGHELFALVTQTITSEVAVVQVTGGPDVGTPGVLDADPSNPGLTHLRVAGRPGAIATTPGGHASFVAIEEQGKEGIMGLPTSCLFAPRTSGDAQETARDVTTWPACSLPSVPGDMQVLVDQTSGGARARCADEAGPAEDLPTPPAASRASCAVNLFDESGPVGARKLVVALPDEGRLVVLDAQALLDRPPASYRSCLDPDVLEASIPLSVDLPETIEQELPADLASGTCGAARLKFGPYPSDLKARPAGMAAREGSLLVADRGAPVVHVFPETPCSLDEQAPLVVTSLEQPSRVVTTSKVAISPTTPSGERYAYVVDDRGRDHASVAVFDLTPGRVSRTPLIRPDSTSMPLEPADRIEFAAAVKDVGFASLDWAVPDPDTDVSTTGVRCDPDPDLPDDAAGALYRPSQDLTTGARPTRLRGLFGFALLSSGGVGVIDIDDFDAECRRPTGTNQAAGPDFRGCSGDPRGISSYTHTGRDNGTPTVSGELSCNMSVPHRARSADFWLDADGQPGTTLPLLGSYPRLSRYARSLPLSRATPEGRKSPILLGVDFEAPEGGRPGAPAQVYVGGTLRTRGDLDEPLQIDPNLAEQASLVLPFAHPRAYPQSEAVTVTYEGALAPERRTGRLGEDLVLSDPDAQFCERGVLDARLAEQYGARRFGLSSGAAERFSLRHTDYVQVTSELLAEADGYWSAGQRGASCGGGGGFAVCDSVFGDGRDQELPSARDFTIQEAYQSRLVMTPRESLDRTPEQTLELLDCCFPGPLSYRLRAGHQWVVLGERTGFSHSVKASLAEDPETGEKSFRCELDCSPLAPKHEGRAFELSSTRCEDPGGEALDSCRVGPFGEDDVVCAYDARKGSVSPGEVGSECIFDAPHRRFALYRGLEPSLRDMTFAVEVMGGFRGQTVSLTSLTQTTVLLPMTLAAVGDLPLLGVVDSQDRGLIMVDLRALGSPVSFY